MSTQPHARVRRRRRFAAVAALGVLGLLAACEAPDSVTGSVYDAWTHNDKPAAAAHATPAAVDELFAHPYQASSEWAFGFCSTSSPFSACFWFNKTESKLVLEKDLNSGLVVGAAFVVHPNPVSGQLFHAWRLGDKARAASFGTPAAVNELFAHPYRADSHWEPGSCDGAAGSIYCTWWNKNQRSITLRYDNLQSHLVTDILWDVADPSDF